MRNWIFGLLACVVFFQCARAEEMGANSVEWLTVASKIVAVGKVLNVEKIKGPSAVLYETYTFEPSFIAKGEKTKAQFKFTIRTFSTQPVLGRIINLSDRVVVFLSDYSENEDFLRNKLVPTTDQYPLSITRADVPAKYFISIDFQVLRNADEILAIVKNTIAAEKRYLKQNSKNSIKRRYLKVPMGTAAFQALYSGSECFLFVPSFMSASATDKLF